MATKSDVTPPPTGPGGTAASPPVPPPPRKRLKKFASAGGYVLAVLIAILAFLGLLFPKEARGSEARARIERLEQMTRTMPADITNLKAKGQTLEGQIGKKADSEALARLEARFKILETDMLSRLTKEQVELLTQPLVEGLEKLRQQVFPFGENPPNAVIGHQPIQ
jgi:hypothetical protein